jgi:hypothetical protein
MENINVNETVNADIQTLASVEEKKDSEFTTIRVKKETVEKVKRLGKENEKLWQTVDRLVKLFEERQY